MQPKVKYFNNTENDMYRKHCKKTNKQTKQNKTNKKQTKKTSKQTKKLPLRSLLIIIIMPKVYLLCLKHNNYFVNGNGNTYNLF